MASVAEYNIEMIKTQYQNDLNEYQSKYKEWAKLARKVSNICKTKGSENCTELSGDSEVQGYFKELKFKKNNLDKIQKKLTDFYAIYKAHINELEDKVKSSSQNIEKRTDDIEAINNEIGEQDQKIIDYNSQLLSKNRQVNFTKERNNYRFTMMIILIMINILLISFIVIYY